MNKNSKTLYSAVSGFFYDAFFGFYFGGYFYGASGMFLSVNDLSKIGLLLYNGGEYNGKRIVSEEFVYEADIEPRKRPADLTAFELRKLADIFLLHMSDVAAGSFAPNIVYIEDEPKEFGVFPMKILSGRVEYTDSVSEMLRKFYSDREAAGRMKQKSAESYSITVRKKTHARFAQKCAEPFWPIPVWKKNATSLRSVITVKTQSKRCSCPCFMKAVSTPFIHGQK